MNNFDLTFLNSPSYHLYSDYLGFELSSTSSDSVDSASSISIDSVDSSSTDTASITSETPSPVVRSYTTTKWSKWSSEEMAKLKEIIKTVGTNWKKVASLMQESGFERTAGSCSKRYELLRPPRESSRILISSDSPSSSGSSSNTDLNLLNSEDDWVSRLHSIITPATGLRESISSSSSDTSLLNPEDDWVSRLHSIITPTTRLTESISSSSSSNTDSSLLNSGDDWVSRLHSIITPTTGLAEFISSSSSRIDPGLLNSGDDRKEEIELSDLTPKKITSLENFGMRSNNITTKRQRWKREDDQRLLEILNGFKSGAVNWKIVAKKMGKYDDYQCKNRYFRVLDPTISKSPFSAEEINNIFSLVNEIGKKWIKIAEKLPGRTPINIRNVWKTITKSQSRVGSSESESTSLQSSSGVKRNSPVDNSIALTEQSKKLKSIDNSLELVEGSTSSNFLPEAPWNLRTDTTPTL